MDNRLSRFKLHKNNVIHFNVSQQTECTEMRSLTDWTVVKVIVRIVFDLNQLGKDKHIDWAKQNASEISFI